MDIPLIGGIIEAFQPIVVDRSRRDSRRASMLAIAERSRQSEDPKQASWPQLVVFPEGSTGNGSAIMRFRLGAFTPGAAVQPAVVSYDCGPLDPCLANGGPDVIPMSALLSTRLCNELHIRYLDLRRPTSAEVKDPALFAENTRKAMAKALGALCSAGQRGQRRAATGGGNKRLVAHPVPPRPADCPLSNCSIKDMMLQQEAHLRGLTWGTRPRARSRPVPASRAAVAASPAAAGAGVVEVESLEARGLTLDDAKRRLARFAAVGKSRGNALDPNKLASALSVAADGPLHARILQALGHDTCREPTSFQRVLERTLPRKSEDVTPGIRRVFEAVAGRGADAVSVDTFVRAVRCVAPAVPRGHFTAARCKPCERADRAAR